MTGFCRSLRKAGISIVCVGRKSLGNLERLSGGRNTLGPPWVGLGLCALTFWWQFLPNSLLSAPYLSPGLVQRCVIIQKDQHGFGFTVSGDRIVLVQSVRPGECCVPATCSSYKVLTKFLQSHHVCDSAIGLEGLAHAFSGGLGILGHEWFILELVPQGHLGKSPQC